ncbi:hypothetical protein EIN_424250 [Entamoeba invadens IP1]|uniref:Uncharacterized protein n=1 Tax=Entamoeba invadens IP1 TaxID=370355 RepID=A0A0A1U5S6_ENTIV|nr:hypothetical protein EIN_424250 [Entamoeba invadens IP1]ELP89743.1 hypothetical protein EIN_424250 [Entamoeba invadens IP1]|eukprot:XP_004256514.1 hypothetical protein EIN_424250 [Entamoeba invadens IP1]
MTKKNNNERMELTIKMLMLGESGVGKTSLLLRFTENKFFKDITSTIGIDFRMKRMEFEGMMYRLQLWDTAGQERFRTIVTSYYRGVSGIILVYDVTSKESFENIKYWSDNVNKNAEEYVELMLIGNKTDLEQNRVVSSEQGQMLADTLGIPFLETNAISYEKTVSVFRSLLGRVINRKSGQCLDKSNHINVNDQVKKTLTCC